MKRFIAFLSGLVCAWTLALSPVSAQTNSYKQTSLASSAAASATDRLEFNSNGRSVVVAIDPQSGAISASMENGTVALAADNSTVAGAIYKGIALVHNSSGDFLLATNFRSGKVEVFDSNFSHTEILGSGAFNDTDLPAVPTGANSPGFAAFGAHLVTVNSTSMVAVTYALQDPAQHDPLRFAGAGFVDLFSTNGTMLRRISDSHLNAPWGVAMPPASFGAFGANGNFLVGNFGDGTINAFDSVSGNFVAQMKDQHGASIANAGLREMAFGSGGSAIDPKAALFITADLGSAQHQLFASILPDVTSATTPDFTVAATPATQTITAGSPATYQVSVTSVNGFNSAVNLTCSGQPVNSSCNIATSVTPMSDSSVMTTLTITTNSNPYHPVMISRPIPRDPFFWKLLPIPALALLVMLLFGSRRLEHSAVTPGARFAWAALAMLLAVGTALAATGCGYNSSSAGTGTQRGADTIMITGTSGQLTHSTSVMLTVQ